MADLHTRLLGELDDLDMRIGGTGPLIPTIRAVVELHAPRQCCGANCHELCRTCPGDFTTYPCPTVAAVAEALGVEATDG